MAAGPLPLATDGLTGFPTRLFVFFSRRHRTSEWRPIRGLGLRKKKKKKGRKLACLDSSFCPLLLCRLSLLDIPVSSPSDKTKYHCSVGYRIVHDSEGKTKQKQKQNKTPGQKSVEFPPTSRFIDILDSARVPLADSFSLEESPITRKRRPKYGLKNASTKCTNKQI